MEDIINLIRDWGGTIPIVEILIASGLLSAGLLAIRKWRLYKNAASLFNKDWFTDLTVITLGFGEALIHYLVTTPFDNPKMVALQGALQVFAMNRLYIFLLKPGYGKLKAQVEKAKKLNDDIKQAGTPVTATPDTSARVEL